MSLLKDLLDGKYPDYSVSNFGVDLAFSILNQIDEKRKAKVYLTPSAYRNDSIRITAVSILNSSLRNPPEVLEGQDVPEEELKRIEYVTEPRDSYEMFLEHLKSKGLECTREEFRTVQMVAEYFECFADMYFPGIR